MVMRDHIFTFNNFVNSLKISMGSLDDLAERPSRITSSAGTAFASFSLLQKFRQQAAAARRAMFSHFKQCSYNGSMVHNVYLQLPGWEDVSNSHSRDAIEAQMAQLFFIKCPHNDWQHARMYFLRAMHANACKKLKLCKALRNAYDNKRDLEFYISEDVDSPDSGEIPIHIPIDPKRGRRYGESLPDDSISLWTLIKQGYFAKEESIDLWLGNDKGTILGFDQRKALAVRLVLGLMLSMDSDHIIDTWDPKQIHFLKPRDMELTPFVPIHGNTRSPGIQNRLFLTNLDMSDEMGDEYSEPTPLPPFALLAKALLHIARGERLETLKMSYKSENTFRDACNRLDYVVERYISKVINGYEVDRQVLPFLIAARNCLRFHTQYQLRLNIEGSKHRMEIAWKLVFEEILAKIDSSLVLEKLVPSSIDASVKEEPRLITDHTIATPVTALATNSLKEWAAISSIGTITAQPEVTLFDGEDTTENSRDTERARAFFKMLDNFHSSYSRFVTDRIGTPRRIRIAILDTGIDFQHAGIMQAKEEGRMKEEWCHSWVGDDVRDEDDELHGTNCAYLLHKAAPEAEIYVEKVFQHNSFKVYQAQNIAKAIEHAVKTWNVDIISMSFGLTPPVPRTDKNLDAERLALQQFEEIVSDIESAIHDASAASPRIIFAAASNNGKNGKRAFPAKYGQGVICVHASDGNGTDIGINPPTESGANLMTLGMGLELYKREWVHRAGRRVPAHKKTYKSGTSFATPIAAGIAATVLDLANRVQDINDRTRDKLKRAENMEKMFLKLMSSPNHSAGDHYSFLAPWHLWETHWESNLPKSQLVWGKINDLFAVDGFTK
ncbi:minor extracellular protease epr [Trichoderma arundinaceum]|uniref:Minor extracellular protease epr n=1 Tax=Trichoderma arundinaceum TaxID=490622 RepID=A0A395NY28_TRIAR|nr:minor extracellular protease epr [Trichoderma arundinaceum]